MLFHRYLAAIELAATKNPVPDDRVPTYINDFEVALQHFIQILQDECHAATSAGREEMKSFIHTTVQRLAFEQNTTTVYTKLCVIRFIDSLVSVPYVTNDTKHITFHNWVVRLLTSGPQDVISSAVTLWINKLSEPDVRPSMAQMATEWLSSSVTHHVTTALQLISGSNVLHSYFKDHIALALAVRGLCNHRTPTIRNESMKALRVLMTSLTPTQRTCVLLEYQPVASKHLDAPDKCTDEELRCLMIHMLECLKWDALPPRSANPDSLTLLRKVFNVIKRSNNVSVRELAFEVIILLLPHSVVADMLALLEGYSTLTNPLVPGGLRALSQALAYVPKSESLITNQVLPVLSTAFYSLSSTLEYKKAAIDVLLTISSPSWMEMGVDMCAYVLQLVDVVVLCPRRASSLGVRYGPDVDFLVKNMTLEHLYRQPDVASCLSYCSPENLLHIGSSKTVGIVITFLMSFHSIDNPIEHPSLRVQMLIRCLQYLEAHMKVYLSNTETKAIQRTNEEIIGFSLALLQVLTASVGDPSPAVRLNTFRFFAESTFDYSAIIRHEKIVQMLFIALRDETPATRTYALKTLCGLVNSSQAHVIIPQLFLYLRNHMAEFNEKKIIAMPTMRKMECFGIFSRIIPCLPATISHVYADTVVRMCLQSLQLTGIEDHILKCLADLTPCSSKVETVTDVLFELMGSASAIQGNSILRCILSLIQNTTTNIHVQTKYVFALIKTWISSQLDDDTCVRILGHVGMEPAGNDAIVDESSSMVVQVTMPNMGSQLFTEEKENEYFAKFCITSLSRTLKTSIASVGLQAECIKTLGKILNQTPEMKTSEGFMVSDIVIALCKKIIESESPEVHFILASLGSYVRDVPGVPLSRSMGILIPFLLIPLTKSISMSTLLILEELCTSSLKQVKDAGCADTVCQYCCTMLMQEYRSKIDACLRVLRVLRSVVVCQGLRIENVVFTLSAIMRDESTASNLIARGLHVLNIAISNHNLSLYAPTVFCVLQVVHTRFKEEQKASHIAAILGEVYRIRLVMSGQVGNNIDAYLHLMYYSDARKESGRGVSYKTNSDSGALSSTATQNFQVLPPEMLSLKQLQFDSNFTLCARMLYASSSKALQCCVILCNTYPEMATEFLNVAFLSLCRNKLVSNGIIRQMVDVVKRFFLSSPRRGGSDSKTLEAEVKNVVRLMESLVRAERSSYMDLIEWPLIAEAAGCVGSQAFSVALWEKEYNKHSTSTDSWKQAVGGLMRSFRSLGFEVEIPGAQYTHDVDEYVQSFHSKEVREDWVGLYKSIFGDDIDTGRQSPPENLLNFAANAAVTLGDWETAIRYNSSRDLHLNWCPSEVLSVISCLLSGNLAGAKQSLEVCWKDVVVRASEVVRDRRNARTELFAAQYMSEIGEIISYKEQPSEHKLKCLIERMKYRIENAWWNSTSRQRLLSLRTLLCPPHEFLNNWTEHIRLCVQEGNTSLAFHGVSQLLQQDPNFTPKQLLNVVTSTNSSFSLVHAEAGISLCDVMWASHDPRTALLGLRTLLENYPEPSNVRAEILWRLGLWESELSCTTHEDVIQNYTDAIRCEPTNSEIWYSWAVSCIDSGIPELLSDAIKGFIKSFERCKSLASAHQLLKLLNIVFHNGDMEDVLKGFRTSFPAWGVDRWLPVLPQIIARLNHPVAAVNECLIELLGKIGASYPQEVVFPMLVWKDLTSGQQQSNEVLERIRSHHPQLVADAEMFAWNLVNVAGVWIEKWIRVTTSAWAKFEEKKYSSLCDDLSALLEDMRTSRVPLETFHYERGTRMYNALSTSITHYRLSKRESDMLGVWSNLDTIYHSILERQKHMKRISLKLVAPWLATLSNSSLHVPGTQVLLHSSVDSVEVLSSKQRPRKISFIGQDGNTYSYLLKGNEDLRQDERVQQLFGIVNKFLRQTKHIRSKIGKHLLGTYSVTPLSPTVGLCRWLDDTQTLAAIVKEQRLIKSVSPDLEHGLLMEATQFSASPNSYYQLTDIQKAEALDYVMQRSPETAKDLANFLWTSSPSSEAWLDRRIRFTLSTATVSFVGYILGSGDRHPNNILIHRGSGRSIHIDFGDCFEVAMIRKRYPEKVPFRLTRMMTTAMGVGGEYIFQHACTNIFEVLIENKETISTLLEAFVHDPLVNWNVRPEIAVERVKAKLQMPHTQGSQQGNQKNTSQRVEEIIRSATELENIACCYLGWSPYW
eukprot:PhF_6_TR26658/c0_g1_i1/m.38673/K07203/MTOR, FRAP, TOR; serine/threonine-protein kinase mTOR